MLAEERQQVRVSGKVADFDLARMGFTPERIGGSFLLDASASATNAGSYAARVGLDSIELRNGYRTDRIRPTSVSFATDTASTRAGVSSGEPVADLLIAQSAGSLSRPDPARRHAGAGKSASKASIWSGCNPCFPISTCGPPPGVTIS